MVRRAAVAALPLALGACSWFTDFKQQPSVGPWQVFNADSAETKGFRGNPRGSVSINGTAMPEWIVGYGQLPGVIDSMSSMVNPVAADLASVQRGRKYYQINCAVCHGHAGLGDGTATKLGMVPMPLISDRVKKFSDGYIWGMMRNGRGLMPSANRIEENDRWDVVNYIRALQGGLPGVVADTTPAGLPGETGDKLPGATRLGPGRSAPYAHPALTASPKAAAPAAPASAPPAAETKTEGHES
jgi:mono/diheme cytochrome c family protein